MSSITAQSVQASILAFLDQAKMYMNAYGIYGLAAIPAFWLTYYVGFNVLMYIRGPVDLKKKYNAEWALVTGAGTGIGKSLAHALALQGLNVVLVSLPDKHLDATTKELQGDFPDLEFRAVKAVFDHKTDYMPAIIEATEDIDVQIVFNNAGYIVTGFFDHTSLDAQLANLECNATACVKVTHHFLKEMLTKKLKGTFVFTSSVSGYIPNPFAVIYGATKAFVSEFAASLSVEVRNEGIDVLAVHPSPVSSNFFDKAHKLDSLEIAKGSAVSADTVPAKIFSCIGRCTYGDLGGMATFMRFVTFVLPFDFLAGLFSYWATMMGDYSQNNANRGVQQNAPGAAAAAKAPTAPKAEKAPSASAKSPASSKGRSRSRGRK